MSDKKRGMGIADFIADEARNAVRDVRQRLFEEAWFGRVVTIDPNMPQRNKLAAIEHEIALADLWERALGGKPERRDQGFEELWSPGRHGDDAPEQKPEPDIER